MPASCCSVGFPVCFSAAVSSIHTIPCTKSAPLSGRGRGFLPVLCVCAWFCACLPFLVSETLPFPSALGPDVVKASSLGCCVLPFLLYAGDVRQSKHLASLSQVHSQKPGFTLQSEFTCILGCIHILGRALKKNPPALVLLRCLVSVVVNKRGFFPFVSFFLFCFGVRA